MATLPLPFTASVGDTPIAAGRRASPEDFAGADFSGLGKTVRGAIDTFVSDTEDKESRAALVASTEIRAKYAKALDDAAISGAPLEPIKEAMNADLAKIGDGFQTKRGADTLSVYQSIANLMFNEQANAVAVRRAAVAARSEGQKLVNGAGAIMRSNPLYLPEAVRTANDFVDTFRGISPELRTELKDKFTKDLNASAVAASARIDPEGTKAKLEAGEWNLEPEQRVQGIHMAEREIEVKRAAADRDRTLARQDRIDRDREAERKFVDLIVARKTSGAELRRMMQDNHDLSGDSVKGLVAFMHAQSNYADSQENKSAVTSLWSRIVAEDGTPGKIYDNKEIIAAVNAGRIKPERGQWLIAQVAAQRDEGGRTFAQRLGQRLSIERYGVKANPFYNAVPELPDAILMELTDRAYRAEKQMRADGKPVNALLDPDSKDYLFTPTRVKDAADAVRARSRPTSATGAPTEKGTRLQFDGFEWEYLGGPVDKPSSYKKLGPVSSGGIR
jgi:hypothetical protein